jgi:cytidyltransferase-like protein
MIPRIYAQKHGLGSKFINVNIFNKIKDYESIANISKALKMADKRIIFKSGCFDILHVGHVLMLEKAKSYADVLVVGIGSDKYMQTRKSKAIFDEKNRAFMIAALQCVDYVLILNEEIKGNIDHEEALRIIKPNFYYLPPDDIGLVNKRKMANEIGVEIILEKSVEIMNHGEIIEPHSSDLKIK